MSASGFGRWRADRAGIEQLAAIGESVHEVLKDLTRFGL
jgi:hypothetical protein